METRYNLKSPGEPGWGGGRRPGIRGAARRLGGLVSAGPRGCSGLALYARPRSRPVRGCRPQGRRAGAADTRICWRPLAPGLSFSVSAE